MSDIQLTKRVLASTMKELMNEIPLSKITVGDIVKHCGLNRNTFYYHFKDKYDLVNWIYYIETLEQMTCFSDKDHWADGLTNLCLYMQENKKFYINALNTPGQNSFSEYLMEFVHDLLIHCINELKGNKNIEKDDMEFIADFYSYAFVGLIVKWAKQGMKENPAYHVSRIKDLITGSLLNELEGR